MDDVNFFDVQPRRRKAAASDMITEGTVADAFAAEHRDKLRYDHTAGRWFVWTGTHWQREETRKAYRWAHDLARSLAADADNAKAIREAGKASPHFSRDVMTSA